MYNNIQYFIEPLYILYMYMYVIVKVRCRLLSDSTVGRCWCVCVDRSLAMWTCAQNHCLQNLTTSSRCIPPLDMKYSMLLLVHVCQT